MGSRLAGFIIKNKATGLVIDNSGLSRASGPHIILWTPNGGTNQNWTLRLANAGFLGGAAPVHREPLFLPWIVCHEV